MSIISGTVGFRAKIIRGENLVDIVDTENPNLLSELTFVYGQKSCPFKVTSDLDGQVMCSTSINWKNYADQHCPL